MYKSLLRPRTRVMIFMVHVHEFLLINYIIFKRIHFPFICNFFLNGKKQITVKPLHSGEARLKRKLAISPWGFLFVMNQKLKKKKHVEVHDKIEFSPSLFTSIISDNVSLYINLLEDIANIAV